tara:strand:- start:309 stop:725 length:417 start_codon:yes stop_codon:yes gene_type:complete
MSFSLLKNLTLYKTLRGGDDDKSPLMQTMDFIAALVTVSITIMDLGVDYNMNEIQFFRHPLVQSIAVFAIGYTSCNGNWMLTLALCAAWFFIKHRFNINSFTQQKDPEEAYKATVIHLLRKLKNRTGSSNISNIKNVV